MTIEYEARITQYIVEFEGTHFRNPAEDAAYLLAGDFALAPPEVGAEYRQQSRLKRVALWGRLWSAIDALRELECEPNRLPSVVAPPDPAMSKEYAEWLARTQLEARKPHCQLWLRNLDQTVDSLAEDYFKSAFVRSAKSVAFIDSCAESGKWTSARKQQVRSWVQPEELKPRPIASPHVPAVP
jgi:hypothetical protein